MVKEAVKNNKTYYQCTECEMFYLDKAIALKCEAWCRKNKSCNIEIIKNAVKVE